MTESIAIVGFIAAVIQFIDFSSKVLHRLSEFRSSLDEVPKSFRDIKTELPLLVDSIDRTRKQTEDGYFSKNTQEAVWSVVKGCQSQVEQLNDILEEILPVEGCSSWRRGKMALLSVYEQKKVQQITTSIRNYIRILTYHQTTSLSTGDSRKDICRWLAAPDPWVNYSKALRERQVGTGSWFIEDKRYTDWKADPNSFIWLYGIPGCGKTILCSTIIEDVFHHCHHKPAMVVIYFFFDFNDSEKQQYEKMIRSLTTQLFLRCTSTPRALTALFSSCMDGEQQPTPDALLTTLQQMICEFDDIFIILDALDECAERKELLETIGNITKQGIWKLHILATSRREKEIEDSLNYLVNSPAQVCIRAALVNNDIQAYIQTRLQNDQNLKRWKNKPEVQQEITVKLMKKADGMFRWAVCQLDTLGRCLNLPRLRKALGGLPTTLDETYDRILCAIDNENMEDALTVMQWLACSARPLRVDEVVDAIAVSSDGDLRFDPENRLPDSQDILVICSSLVTITGAKIRLAHYSVKEYLVSERIQNGRAHHYGIREVHANASIAETCLAYLLQLDSANFSPLREADRFPLARYAAKYWTQHAQAAGASGERMHQLMKELFLSQTHAYVNWIQLCDPDRPWDEPELPKDLQRVASPLYYASLSGLVEPVRVLLGVGADVNARGGWCDNALQAASAGGHEQIVQWLLEKGADVNMQGGRYGNALQAASAGGHDQVLGQLLENDADVNAQGGYYNSALLAASYGGHDQIVQELLKKNVDVNVQGGEFGNALLAASYNGHGQIVQRLLESGADLNAQGRILGTALQAASNRGHHQVVQRLLERGADVNVQGGDYGNALQAASDKGYSEIVQWLLEKGTNVNASGGLFGSALQAASAKGYDDIVWRLLEKGADADAQGGWFGSALQAATTEGYTQIAHWLVEKGASINAQGGWYGNALQAASAGGHYQMVQWLVEKGANVNAQGGWYDTALQAASTESHGQIVQYLLKKGAAQTPPPPQHHQ